MKYKVVERRIYKAVYLIESESKEDAEQLTGDIIEEIQEDCHGYDLVSCEETEATEL